MEFHSQHRGVLALELEPQEGKAVDCSVGLPPNLALTAEGVVKNADRFEIDIWRTDLPCKVVHCFSFHRMKARTPFRTRLRFCMR